MWGLGGGCRDLPSPTAGGALMERGGAPFSLPPQIGLYKSAAWREMEAMLLMSFWR